MKLIVKNSAGNTISIQIKSNETFKDLQERVEVEAGISLDLKDIALKGKKIRESQRVMEYFLSYGKTCDVEEDPLLNVYCAVPGCNNTKQLNPDKVFFEFPTDQIRCHQWVLYCQRLSQEPGKKRLSLTTESAICSDHFRADQFVKNTHTLLKRTAVPSLLLPVVATPRELTAAPSSSSSPPPPLLVKQERSSPKLYDLEPKNIFSEESQDVLDVREDRLTLRLCRLCADSCEDYIMIFDEEGRHLKIAEKINLCLPIEVQMTDGLPKQICRSCYENLNELFQLADTSSLAQEKLLCISELCLSDEESGSSGVEKCGVEEGGCCPLCCEGQLQSVKELEKKDLMSRTTDLLSQTVPMPVVSIASDMTVDSMTDPSSTVSGDCHFDSQFSLSDDSKKNTTQTTIIGDDFDSNETSNKNKINDFSSLKIEDNSDLLNDCYLSDIGFDEKARSYRSQLSPINEESNIENDPQGMFHSSENSNSQPPLETEDEKALFCRICAMEFRYQKDLFQHSYLHSFKGFYQCAACVTVCTNEEDFKGHFLCHDEEEDQSAFCEVCLKSFSSDVVLASHLCRQESAQENVEGIKCHICKKTLRNEAKLKQHLKTYHDDVSSAYCEICNKHFTDEIKLHKHNMYSHAKQKSHCCEECGKVFKSEASMRYHQKSHLIPESYTCERCGNSFPRKSMLISHMTSSHKDSVPEIPCFTCKICYEAFPSTGAAVAHMDNHHKVECMKDSTYSFEMHSVSKLFVCEFCERYYAESTVLYQHREQHPTQTPFECKHCDTNFPTSSDVLNHRAEHLSEEIPTEYLTEFNIPGRYLCEYCERCFLNEKKYDEHLTVHFGSAPYQCRNCTLKFSTLVDAVEHRAVHGESPNVFEDYDLYRPYECHFCSKIFAIEDALVKHIRMHTGEKPFICDQCGKGFSQSSGLYTHQKVHSSERPYSCNVCPRTFKIKGDRDVHVRKHSGDRPYKCEFCGKAFMTQHVYSQHRKIHTGERPYKCDVCGIAFRRSHVLTVHKRIHTGEKPNICDICGKRYRQKGDMLKHRRVQHGINSNAKPILELLNL